MQSRLIAVSTVSIFVLLGGGVALDAACAPSAEVTDGGDAGPVCDPDSGDPAGCACDTSKPQPTDCYTGPAGTNGKGPCKTGKRSCTSQGTYSVCVGEVTPQPETCNYTDDDCDGIIDNLPEITDAAVIAKCNSPACDPSFTDAAITCWGPDPGICGAGVKTCTGTPTGGQPTGCLEYIHTPATEICNGIDDDCNGIVDDGLDNEGACDMDPGSMWAPDANPFDGGTPTLVQGECVHGQLSCVSTNCDEHGCKDAGDKCAPSQPSTEIGFCDGLDNDCNGKVDDHACADSFDKQFKYDYCCTDGFFFNCDTKANAVTDAGFYTKCTLAN